MILYWDIQYYPKKQNLIIQKLENAKKLFNLYYLSLQNMVEWIFGVDK